MMPGADKQEIVVSYLFNNNFFYSFSIYYLHTSDPFGQDLLSSLQKNVLKWSLFIYHIVYLDIQGFIEDADSIC
jgi:hypothetical protein